jgi:CRP-like cAMP-binding protein
VEAKREFVHPGDPVQAYCIQQGWVAGVIILADGRRQVVDLFLPGETLCPRSDQGVWNIGLVALTALKLTVLERQAEQPAGNCSSYVYQTNAILRLGCLTAYERVGHLFLELHERLGGNPDTIQATINFPVTQELMADLLGLSAVHINRTLQQLRRDGLVSLKGGKLCLLNRPRLQDLSHYVPSSRAIFSW